jgi:hypothetical protein
MSTHFESSDPSKRAVVLAGEYSKIVAPVLISRRPSRIPFPVEKRTSAWRCDKGRRRTKLSDAYMYIEDFRARVLDAFPLSSATSDTLGPDAYMVVRIVL